MKQGGGRCSIINRCGMQYVYKQVTGKRVVGGGDVSCIENYYNAPFSDIRMELYDTTNA
jgi:hypothetical protein